MRFEAARVFLGDYTGSATESSCEEGGKQLSSSGPNIAISHTQIDEMVDGWGIILFPGSGRSNVVHVLDALLEVTSSSKNVFCLEASEHNTCEILGRDPQIQNPKDLYIPYKKRGPSVCRPPYGIVLLLNTRQKGPLSCGTPKSLLAHLQSLPPEGAVGGSLDDRLPGSQKTLTPKVLEPQGSM